MLTINHKFYFSALMILIPFFIHAENSMGLKQIVSSVEKPRLDPNSRINQIDIENNQLSLLEIRKAGMLIFATPFNKFDGFG